MCNVNHRLKVVLDNETLKKNIDFLRVNDLMLHGGEILAVDSAKELYIWLAEKMKKKVNLITNGLFIDREWAERLIRNSDWIEISVNAASKETHEFINRGSKFEKVIENIKMLIDLKRRYNLNTDVRFHFTIVPENIHEIAQAIEFADRLGCGVITYSFCSPQVENLLFKRERVREKIRNELIQVLKRNLKIKIQRVQLEFLGLVTKFHPLLVDRY
jgi:sulfatase maturation enzyme AslB (radical SAM superfamily)